MPNKVAIYIRVSTQEQAQEGYSIGAQTDRLTAYCKAKDWPIADIYTDAGFSGSNMQRPALQRLIDDVRTGAVDCVLVYKLDRLSRSQKDTLAIIEDILLANACAFVSMSENFDTSTPLGRAMIGILSVFAQLEREQIKERISIGKAERAKAGLWHGGGNRPFGYDYIDGKLVPNELEAIAVREVYDRFLAGESMTSILGVLRNKYGFVERKRITVVRSILTTRVYLGEVSWAGQFYKGRHEPLIDEVTFKRAQALMASPARLAEIKPNPFKSTSLFGALLYCASCGARYMIQGNHSGHGTGMVYRPYYVCMTKAKKSKRESDKVCTNPNYAKVKLDEYLLSKVYKLVESPRLVSEIAGRPKKKKADTNESRRAAILRQIDGIDSQLSRVVDLYQLGSISIHEIGKRSKKLQEEKRTLQATLDKLTEPPGPAPLPLAEIKKLLAGFDRCMESGTIEEKQRMLQQIIAKIIVYPEKGKFDIVWNF